MIRKINKKVAFTASIIISSLFGFLLSGAKGGTASPMDLVLEAPIFSIERSSANDGSGDCSSSSCDAIIYPSPTSAGVAVTFSAP